MPPKFATEAYWDHFFTEKTEPFEWLLAAQNVCDIVALWLPSFPTAPKLLHIGCGNSDLIWRLLDLLESPYQIHNVDYSEIAIRDGKRMEDERVLRTHLSEAQFGLNSRRDSRISRDLPPELHSRMRWTRVDLLSLSSIKNEGLIDEAEKDGRYNLIVDKGTSDSIALGEDIPVELPYRVLIDSKKRTLAGKQPTTTEIHPLNVLAVNLAALAEPIKGRWIVVSFSEDRFPFLQGLTETSKDDDLAGNEIGDGLPHPSSFWRLEKKWSVPAPLEGQLTERAAYTPEIRRWIYVLARTEEHVFFEESNREGHVQSSGI